MRISLSQIPSDIAASAAQAGFTAREASREREASGAGQVHAATRQVKVVNDAGTTVETTDADSRVFTDAEGQGSQGRPFDDQTKSEQQDDPSAVEPGITTGEDGHMHIDLNA